MSKLKLTKRRVRELVLLLAITCICLLFGVLAQQLASAEENKADALPGKRVLNEKEAAIEAASFSRAEFFGAQALVPYPTAEARNRLADLLGKYPDEPQLYLRLSALDEKLGRFAEAESELETFFKLQPDNLEALETLASFFDRRAEFEKEAATIERMLILASPERRAQIFGRLIELARLHQLDVYLKPDFYQKYIAQGLAVFEIIEQLLDKLVEEKNYTEALSVLRQYKDRFPERQSYLLEREISILVSLQKDTEAESVYQKAFDPFWTGEMSGKFYSFLSDHDRLRAYGHELMEAFRRNPADFQIAVRLIHYRNYDGDKSPRIIGQLEQARAARHIKWQPEELATLARILIADGDGDTASRFLYTLYVQNELKPGSPLREKVLYQLFELLLDARYEKLALTRGDLKFYEDIATSDPHPGMLGGVLSLILSDTEPAAELGNEERTAVRFFNRAAAYRIFTAYKQEYPTSPELAQMYLDIVRLYAVTKEPQVAAETLGEFEKRYEDAPRYAEVALKLADCYIALGRYTEERALYQRIMDYLGKKRASGERLVPAFGQSQSGGEQPVNPSTYSEPTETTPSLAQYPPQSNRGIVIPDESELLITSNYNSSYRDYLPGAFSKPQGKSAANADNGEAVTYASVLERHVASLAREKQSEAILALYASEMKKYPDEQGLYEQMLQWLGQTNLFEEQLKVYKEAIAKFPTTVWRDRLARWFLKRDRKQEFQTFSRELLGQLGDAETQDYLSKFISSNASASASTFDADLYLGLYTLAHERFPHNLGFVEGLLKFYNSHERVDEWQRLMAEYYFESREIRNDFLLHLARRGELRAYLERARERSRTQGEDNAVRALDTLPYKLFRADASAHLSNYEEAIDAYRELNRLYPNTPEFSERLIAFTRSLGQRNPKFLEEAAAASHALAESFPSSAQYRTRAGEVQAELGNYDRAKGEWEQLIRTGRGAPDTYLETATVYWDYFQYEDALRVIKQLREQMKDPALYSFQAGAILEARHKRAEAIVEYVKALDFYSYDYGETIDKGRAKRRLVKLYSREGVPAELRLAFELERARRTDSSSLILDYADLLKDAGEQAQAAAVLKQEIARNDSRDFLDSARGILDAEKDEGVGQLALKRLVTVAGSPRFSISYRLQLAADAEQHGRREEAAATLHELVEKFPTNYGVLNEAESFYWRLGLREDSLRVLTDAMRRGKGRFYYVFGRKLAARLNVMNRLPEAEQVLAELHTKDKLNTEVFHELARVLIRTSNTPTLKKAFQETLAAIKQQNLDRKELHAQTAAIRRQMIDAFTRLKDYQAAIEQHIEIINREPEDEENVEAALDYARRYGGADTLLAYYQRTANEAYKNYRWNVVLARIYEAKNDLASAAQNYKSAISNQPEMVELYDALADVYTRMKNWDAALEALQKAAELTNDDPQYIRRTVEVLEKAGRRREAEEARQKLPAVVAPKNVTASDQFAEAARLRATEKSKAVASYREAFNTLLGNPFAQDSLKAEQITGYVQTVRDEERLDKIAGQLWQLRDKLIQEAERKDSKLAGQARASLKVLDGALPAAIGGIASEKATGDELTALFGDFNRRIETALQTNDAFDTLALLQNLSHSSGFGVLEEKILKGQKERAYSTGNQDFYRQRLQGLVDFYTARGAYGQVIELMEAERTREGDGKVFGGYFQRTLAENARLVGDREKELQALRENYRRLTNSLSQQASAADEFAERYLEALYENGERGKQELRELSQQPSAYQLQLINFLLAKGEGELAHEAIERAPFNAAWKLSRHAGASLALADYSPQMEGYFAKALQLKSIGELILQKPDASQQLVGDDWFNLAQIYGQWLYQSPDDGAQQKRSMLLPAMIENKPRDENEQAGLGRFLLERKDYKGALEHLSLALEMNADDNSTRADLGTAAFLSGDEGKARKLWAEIIKGEQPTLENCELYLSTLRAHGLTAEAREKLFPIVAAELSVFGDYESDGENSSGDTERQKQFESLRGIIRSLAGSFRKGWDETSADEASAQEPLESQAEVERAQFFYKLSEAAPDSKLLPEMLIKESLIAKDELAPFYELLIKRSSPLSSYERDYDYVAKLNDTWGVDEAEEALDQETGYKISEPPSERITWQREYLDYLIVHQQREAARGIINSIQAEINQRYARPPWLRLVSLRLDLLDGQDEKALTGLRRFIGIESASSTAFINAPSIERLNMAANMLRHDERAVAADQLLEAAFTRELALERYNAPAFVGLARLAFRKGEAKQGLKLLQMMIALSNEETRDAAAADLASWPDLKLLAADRAKQEGAEMENTLDQQEALRLAAETSSAFMELDAAINYRQQLLLLTQEDETNRIELVRLLAEKKMDEEALNQLAQIMGDRNATRRARWQAVWLSAQIVGARNELWTKLKDGVRAINPGDDEMQTALEALSLASAGRMDEAIKLTGAMQAADPNPYLSFFDALLEKRGRNAGALYGFIRTLVAEKEAKVAEAFPLEENPLRQIIRFYSTQGEPRAALLAAELDPTLKGSGDTEREDSDEEAESTSEDKPDILLDEEASTSKDGARYRTLRERVAEREIQSRVELLGLLSSAAEQVGDFGRAVEFERVRLGLLSVPSERQSAEARIHQLLSRRKENERRARITYTVEQGVIARR